MSSLPPGRLTGPTNELAKERNRAAAERTINAWVGNCLSLIGFGVAFDQINRALQQRFPNQDPAFTTDLSHWIGIGFITAGLVLLVIALVQHWLIVKSIEHHNYVLLSIHTLNRLVVLAILIMGSLGLFTILYLP